MLDVSKHILEQTHSALEQASTIAELYELKPFTSDTITLIKIEVTHSVRRIHDAVVNNRMFAGGRFFYVDISRNPPSILTYLKSDEKSSDLLEFWREDIFLEKYNAIRQKHLADRQQKRELPPSRKISVSQNVTMLLNSITSCQKVLIKNTETMKVMKSQIAAILDIFRVTRRKEKNIFLLIRAGNTLAAALSTFRQNFTSMPSITVEKRLNRLVLKIDSLLTKKSSYLEAMINDLEQPTKKTRLSVHSPSFT